MSHLVGCGPAPVPIFRTSSCAEVCYFVQNWGFGSWNNIIKNCIGRQDFVWRLDRMSYRLPGILSRCAITFGLSGGQCWGIKHLEIILAVQRFGGLLRISFWVPSSAEDGAEPSFAMQLTYGSCTLFVVWATWQDAQPGGPDGLTGGMGGRAAWAVLADESFRRVGGKGGQAGWAQEQAVWTASY